MDILSVWESWGRSVRGMGWGLLHFSDLNRLKVTVLTAFTRVLWPLDVPTPLHPVPGRTMSLSLQV